jgi:excinuclease UvrABC helicase subunit UvrB
MYHIKRVDEMTVSVFHDKELVAQFYGEIAEFYANVFVSNINQIDDLFKLSRRVLKHNG